MTHTKTRAVRLLLAISLVVACRNEGTPTRSAPPPVGGRAKSLDAGHPACGSGEATRTGRGTGTYAEAARTNDELVGGLGDADPNARNRALGELVRRGPAATSSLVHALETPDAELRARVVRGLAEIADPSCADLYARLVGDADERNRAYAAHALARLHDPRALDVLVRTIDDNPDVLHDPETLATYALATMGTAVLPRMAPLLSAPGEGTRVRAFHVIEQVVSKLPGSDWQARWRQLGSYDPRAEESKREPAAEQWRAWIAKQHFPGG